jgi:diguanylate cyclase (GGDEF)-like protein
MDPFFHTISKIAKRIKLEKDVQDYKNNLEEKVEAQTKELAYNYLHDLDTNLPNNKMLQRDLQEQKFSYMILLDISNFATINKAYGKVFANSVIVHTADALKHHIHENARLYKIESDRFIILLKNTSTQQMHNYCEQIISFFDIRNVEIEDVEINISFSIGVTDICENMLETVVNSEFALDKSKKLGSRHYEVFDEDLTCFSEEKDAIKWLKITRDLILNENIEAYFQPIKDIEADEILKYEVLARGITDDGKVIAPINFIAPAEKLGMITSITRTMINKSFAYFEHSEYHFSINIT